jgi:hypothetical protein
MSGHNEYLQVLETLAALDRAIHSPHATTQVFYLLFVLLLSSKTSFNYETSFAEVMN